MNLVERLRDAVLRRLNSTTAASVSALPLGGSMPCYIVVTPHLVHMAPMAAHNHPREFPPVFVANGLDSEDVNWLKGMCPDVPVIVVRAGIRRKSNSMLPHGVIIDMVASARPGPFCLQDADCFVADCEFWRLILMDPATEYAAGPFLKAGGLAGQYPETFFVCVNGDLLVNYTDRYGITSVAGSKPRRRARSALSSAGFGEGQFPEPSKSSYDTLQQYWVMASSNGFRFRYLKGGGETIHHIGGTSYLHSSFEDLAKWDYWPLNVHYFHLRLLEHPEKTRFRPRFKRLIDFHASSEALLDSFPRFRDGWRRRQTDMILENFDRMNSTTQKEDPTLP